MIPWGVNLEAPVLSTDERLSYCYVWYRFRVQVQAIARTGKIFPKEQK